MKVKANYTHAGYHNAAGVRIPSVTTIAKLIDRPEGLIHWAWQCGMDGKNYREVSADACTVGHVAHSMIEAAIKGFDFDDASVEDKALLALASKSLEAFHRWRAGSKMELLETEVRLVSERYQYGGRLDCVASVLGEKCIVDWKTSKGVYPSYVVQVSAYREAYNETHRGQPIEGCQLLRVRKDDAGFVHHYFPPETLDKAFRAFLTCRDLYDQQKALGKAV